MLKIDKKEFMKKLDEISSDEIVAKEFEFFTRKVVSFDRVRISLLNIKNFQLFNHNYGHDEGDVVIEIIEKQLKNKESNNDFYVRFGGNEWLIISFEDKFYTTEPILYRERIEVDCLSGNSYITEIKNLISELDRIRYFRRFYQVECRVVK